MKRLIIGLSAFVLVLGVLSSCKMFEKDPEIGVLKGNTAANFTEPDSNGTPFSLEFFRGSVILLNITTMWCNPCRQEAGELMALYDEYKAQGLEIVMIVLEDEDQNIADLSDLVRWVNEFNLTFPVLYDPDSSTKNLYQAINVPTNIIIDRDFVIQYRQSGYRPPEILETIQKLL
jgi:thiol-disulfide isomerase/thioredoxin